MKASSRQHAVSTQSPKISLGDLQRYAQVYQCPHFNQNKHHSPSGTARHGAALHTPQSNARDQSCRLYSYHKLGINSIDKLSCPTRLEKQHAATSGRGKRPQLQTRQSCNRSQQLAHARMFVTPAVYPGNVLNRSEYCYGSSRFKLSQMEVLSSRHSSDFADDTTIKISPTSTNQSNPRLKKRPCYTEQPTRDATAYMTAGLKKHFDDAEFSDLIVRCRDDEYHVHRVIMCSHSQWFARVCAKAACESTSPRTIDLSADDPSAVDAMLQYCYTLDYADKFLGVPSVGYTIYTLAPHIDIYLLASRYNIPGLKLLAVEKFELRAEVLARIEGSKDKFFQAIRVIYASTRANKECELRKVTVKLCADHSGEFVLKGGKTATRIFKLMDEIPVFRMEFIKELASRLK